MNGPEKDTENDKESIKGSEFYRQTDYMYDESVPVTFDGGNHSNHDGKEQQREISSHRVADEMHLAIVE